MSDIQGGAELNRVSVVLVTLGGKTRVYVQAR